jgi:hypothetical protein
LINQVNLQRKIELEIVKLLKSVKISVCHAFEPRFSNLGSFTQACS